MDANLRGAVSEIPPFAFVLSNHDPLSGSGTLRGG